MKRCPFCAAPGEVRHTHKGGQPFVQCVAGICGAASKPAPTEEAALGNWARHVRAGEAIPSDWRLFAAPTPSIRSPTQMSRMP